VSYSKLKSNSLKDKEQSLTRQHRIEMRYGRKPRYRLPGILVILGVLLGLGAVHLGNSLSGFAR
jgi:hypothetical protein